MSLKTIHVFVIGVAVVLVAAAVAIAGLSMLGLQGKTVNQTSAPAETAPSNEKQTPETSETPETPSETVTPIEAGTYKDMSYGNDPAQKFDICVPQTTATRLPLIIVVHGGAWSAGDKGDFSPISSFLADQGFVVINTNYRLLPAFSYPAPLEDFQMLLQWVNENSVRYRIDVTRIGMTGHSAGGHLIALYALTQDQNYVAGGSTLPKVYAIAPMAGGFTLEGINTSDPRREDTIIEWLRTANPQSLGLPIYQVDSSDNATFLLLHGAEDVNAPPQQSILLYQELTAHGVPAELKIYPGRTHLTLVSGIQNNDEVGQDLSSFFKEKLR
jgi:acetyl esterase/lipase